MTEAYIIGISMTPFGRWPEKDHRQLAREAVVAALADANLPDGQQIDQVYFGSCLMHRTGQTMIRGQATLIGLVDDGMLRRRVPVVNVEGACATGSLAVQAARMSVLSGSAELAMAVGVEKMFDPANPASGIQEVAGGLDNFDRERWMAEYARVAHECGSPWNHGPGRLQSNTTTNSIAMDTYGIQAAWHMHRYGTTREQIAAAAAKSHCNGALNPNAQYRFAMTPGEVLADRPVSGPLTRSMCAPVGDGGAAALVCSERFLRSLPAAARERAIRISASAVSGGAYRALEEPGLSRIAADEAYAAAGVKPEDVDLAEVHDACSFCEIFQAEMLRFCQEGTGGAFVGSGATALDGSLPVNTSGGLVSKGHPIAATGISMAHEIVTQLRGEAGQRQVKDARIGLTENGGGVTGFEEAICVVNILERTAV